MAYDPEVVVSTIESVIGLVVTQPEYRGVILHSNLEINLYIKIF